MSSKAIDAMASQLRGWGERLLSCGCVCTVTFLKGLLSDAFERCIFLSLVFFFSPFFAIIYIKKNDVCPWILMCSKANVLSTILVSDMDVAMATSDYPWSWDLPLEPGVALSWGAVLFLSLPLSPSLIHGPCCHAGHPPADPEYRISLCQGHPFHLWGTQWAT